MADLNEVHYKLGQVDGKMDQMLAAQLEITGTQKTHSKRIGKLERKGAFQLGAAAGVGTISGTIASFFKNFFTGGA